MHMQSPCKLYAHAETFGSRQVAVHVHVHVHVHVSNMSESLLSKRGHAKQHSDCICIDNLKKLASNQASYRQLLGLEPSKRLTFA